MSNGFNWNTRGLTRARLRYRISYCPCRRNGGHYCLSGAGKYLATEEILLIVLPAF